MAILSRKLCKVLKNGVEMHSVLRDKLDTPTD